MKCKLVSELPASGAWVYELKIDGFRSLAIRQGRKVNLISRNKKDLSASYPEIIASLKELPLQQATLDGEIAVLDKHGLPSFQALQNLHTARIPRERLFYFVFDILNYEGRDITQLPLEQRKAVLKDLARTWLPHVRFVRSIEGGPHSILRQVRAHELEGLVGKRSMSTYEAGQRSGTWIKYKISRAQEFVIGGYTEPERSREWFGALLVGFYQDGELHFASKVGTSFTPHMIRALYRRMQPLVQSHCPFVNLPERSSGRWGQGLTLREMSKCTWLKPTLVCEVHFTEWTEGGHLRHPNFKGIREDKTAWEVVREST